MDDKVKLSRDEIQTIIAHNERMIVAARRGRDKCRLIPMKERTQYLINQMEYWQNCVSAFRWSSQIAKQMVERLDNDTGQ